MPIDVLIGIPSKEEAATIGEVVRQADLGLAQLPGPAVIVNVDNGSGNDTRDAFLGTPTRCRKEFLRPDRAAGKGGNVLTLLRLAAERNARAVVLLDADVSTTRPEWVTRLARPVLAGKADFVSPSYATSQGGPLRTLLSRPLVDGLFGTTIDQPTGGEVGLSGDLARAVAATPASPSVQRYGIDIHLTTEAVQSGARLACADLGVKMHRVRPWHTITPIARDVVEAVLEQLYRYRKELELDDVPPDRIVVPPAGTRRVVSPEELAALGDHYREGAAAHESLYRQVLPEELYREVLDSTSRAITPHLWPQLLSAFIRYALDHPEAFPECAAALMPLFEGRMVSYATELEGLPCTQSAHAVRAAEN